MSDLISRQAVLASIKNLYPDMPCIDYLGARRKWLEKYTPYFDCENAVKQLPSAENKGEWIVQPSNKEQGERDFVWWKCSKCGQVIYSETEKDRKEFHAFCGRCGADMRGKAE